MAQLPSKEKITQFDMMLEKTRPDLARLAPAHVADKNGFSARFVTACKLAAARNPSILQCSMLSQQQSAFVAMSLGLLPNVLGHGYFVPFGKDLTWITGYQGIVELAHRSGHISSIEARVVYEGEDYLVGYGTNAGISHTPNLKMSRKPEDPTDVSCANLGITGAYAVAHFKDGGVKFECMSADELDGIRKKTRSRSGPWHEWPNVIEMYKKCPIRRLGKTLPQTPDLHMALEYDNAAERGVPQIIDIGPAIADDGQPAEKPKPLASHLCPVCEQEMTTAGCTPGYMACKNEECSGKGHPLEVEE